MYQKRLTGWARHWDFLLLDSLCLCAAFGMTYFVEYDVESMVWESAFFEIFYLSLVLNFGLLVFFDTMEGVITRGYGRELMTTLHHVFALLMGITLFLFTIETTATHLRDAVFLTMVVYAALSYGVRVFWRKMIIRFSKNKPGKALLVLTTEQYAPELVAELKRNNFGRHVLVGVSVPDPQAVEKELCGVPVVSSRDNLVNYVTQNWVDEVLVAEPMRDFSQDDLVEKLIGMGVTVHFNIDLAINKLNVKHILGNVGGHWVISSSMNAISPGQAIIKRSMDIAGGLVGCVLAGIIYLFIAPRIHKESPGPIIFSQTRIGKNGKPFKFYKFRSMYLDAEQHRAELMEQNRINGGYMFKLDFDPRIIGNRIDENGKQVTGIGDFIRRTSLDEFPQFYNVLRGEMSLVGTRPPLVDEYEAYSAYHKARLSTKPGITGMWQVSGRSNILDFDEVVRLDTWYINNWSVGLDLKILFKTLLVAFKQEGSM